MYLYTYRMRGWMYYPKWKSQFIWLIFSSDRWGGTNITIILKNNIFLFSKISISIFSSRVSVAFNQYRNIARKTKIFRLVLGC